MWISEQLSWLTRVNCATADFQSAMTSSVKPDLSLNSHEGGQLPLAAAPAQPEHPPGCCARLVQFTQETSFTGLKYIGGANNSSLRR